MMPSLRPDPHLFWDQLRVNKLEAAVVLLLALACAASEGLTIVLILSFLRSQDGSGSALATGWSWIDQAVLAVGQPQLVQVLHIAGALLFATWLRSGLMYLADRSSAHLKIRMLNRIRGQAFDRLIAVDYEYFTRHEAAPLVTAVTSDVAQLSYVLNELSTLFSRGLFLPVYLGILLYMCWPLALVAIACFALVSVMLGYVVGKTKVASRASAAANAGFVVALLEFLQGMRTIHLFATADGERARYRHASATVAERSRGATLSHTLVAPVSEGLGGTILVGTMALGMGLHLLSIGALLTFMFVLVRLAGAVRWLNTARGNVGNAQGSIDRVQALLSPGDKPLFVDGHAAFPGLREHITFEDVDFGYVGGPPVLRGVNLTFARGQLTAIVGASGAGKSTIADLTLRLFKPTSGRILVDGVDLQDFRVASYRRRIAMVSQDVYLFNRTVRENIAYGLEGVDGDRIREAAERANALAFITALPQGFETVVGERAVRLSGGQRQRLAIARAFLVDPEILVLDEATSALDAVSERLIHEAITSLGQHRTVIAISHRLSTILRADQIIVLAAGQVVERGTYPELLALRGEFWRLHEEQLLVTDEVS